MIRRSGIQTLAERFARHVAVIPFHPCWEWMGYVADNGYGMTGIGKQPIGAHRAAFMLYRGPIPKGKYVCHRCDNRSCVNPEHLFVGSATENERDKIAKGRRGNIGRRPTKLLDSDMAAIKQSRDAGESFTSIARRYGVVRGDTVRRRLNRLEG